MSRYTTPAEIARAWFEVLWTQKRPECIDLWMHEDAVGVMEDGLASRADFKAFYQVFVTTFPDAQIEVERLLCDGDECAVRWVLHATHRGDGVGVAPTGKRIAMRGTTWMTFRDGRIIGGFDTWNLGALMKTIGAEDQIASCETRLANLPD